MFKKIVVGLDGREGGRDALTLAARLAGDGGELIATQVFPYDSHPSRAALGEFAVALREDAQKSLDHELAEAGVDARTMVVGDSSYARGLHHAAEHERADLIVVGSTHHGPLGRVLVGDVARGTLHGAPCAVAVASRGLAREDRGPSTIGVGFDDSEESREALAVAVDLAHDTGARLELLSVIQLPVAMAFPTAYTYEWTDLAERDRTAVEEQMEGVVAELDVDASASTVSGSAAKELTELSRRVDLMVVGSRRWGPARRLLLGSTADHLAGHSACPLLVLPRGEGTGQPGEREPAGVAADG